MWKIHKHQFFNNIVIGFKQVQKIIMILTLVLLQLDSAFLNRIMQVNVDPNLYTLLTFLNMIEFNNLYDFLLNHHDFSITNLKRFGTFSTILNPITE